jgi:molecular chaperone GrpE (heat shock protein)
MDELDEPPDASEASDAGGSEDGPAPGVAQAGEPDAELIASERGEERPPVVLADQLEALRQAFEERFLYDATKEEAFRQLYTDLEEFRALASGAQHRPVLVDIVLLLDRVEKGLEAEPADEFIESIRDELSEILARRGVSAMSVGDDRFDPMRQRAVGTRPAADENLHNSVAEVARTGYECAGQILRAAEVIVYRYSPASTAPAPAKGGQA